LGNSMPDVTTARIRGFPQVHVYTGEAALGEAPRLGIPNSSNQRPRPAPAVFARISGNQPVVSSLGNCDLIVIGSATRKICAYILHFRQKFVTINR
jgi:hypothetical protein